ncbi:MAG: hypothetical protein QOF78_3911 [Phycisphaerales bacterium]|nr:hypothetical protein [Phycisphaerales bacterium]
MIHALLAQAPPAPPLNTTPNAATVFYITLLFIFLTAIITTVVTKWARDKCLKFFHGFHVTLERTRGQTIWGQVKIFATGVEIIYDHPFIDPRGRKKTSYMLYGAEFEQQLLSLFRYGDELTDAQKKRRKEQIRATFNPGPMKRLWRKVRNFVNTLRDAFNAAIGAVVSQYQRANPSSAVLSSQGGNVTQIGQTLLGRFAGNAYEPLLEQYIGHPVIVDVVDPINPNNAIVEYAGYLVDYTQNFLAVFNVEHETGETVVVTLPDVEEGPPLPPLPNPPPPGVPLPSLPPPERIEHELAIRIDGLRIKVQNTRHEPVVVRRLERDGFEPVEFGNVIPPSATFDLPARDARGGRLIVELVRMLDLVAPRKFAVIRHAGELVARRGFTEEFHLRQLPLVPTVLGKFRNGGK